MAGKPKHGLSQTRIYRTWSGMKQRCYNPNSVPYPYYGARGITVCDEWRCGESGFMSFYKWSMENGYSDTLTIDRIDPLKGYYPDNCRWATKTEQALHLNRKTGSSGYRGISKHHNADTYYGRVKVDKVCICTGSAKTALDAAIMMDKYIIEHNLKNELNGVI